MATAENSRSGKLRNRRTGGAKGLQPRRLWLRAAAWTLVIVAVLLFWYRVPIAGRAVVASSVAARVACSCRYVAGRDLDSCRTDFEPGMTPVLLSENAEAHSITARYALFAPQTATYRAGEGCVLEKWKD